MEVRKAVTNPRLKSYENEKKIDNDYVLRNDHRIKTTQPISMILVSFFAEDNVLSDEIKICYQSNEIRAFRFPPPLFFLGGGGDTRYIHYALK